MAHVIYKRMFLLIPGVLMACLPSLQSQSLRLNAGCFERMTIENEKNVNSKNLETFPAWYRDSLAFIQGTDGGRDLQIAIAIEKSEDGWKGIRFFNKKINSSYFEGPFCWDIKNNKLYFTRTDASKKKSKTERSGKEYTKTSNPGIWEYDLNAGGDPVESNLNNKEYSVSDPAISPDGEWMIFSSDMPGGFGGRDLYIAMRDASGWVGVTNLGPDINSPKNECFSGFIHQNMLVFASNRDGGPGGFDLYYTIVENGLWTKPQLFPKPVNSPSDDLSFIVAPNHREGYLATNRPGGKGEDDIYHWKSTQSLFQTASRDTSVNIDIFVFEKLTLLPFPEAEIVITPLEFSREDIRLDDPNIDFVNMDTTGSLYLKWNTLLKNPETVRLLTDDKGNAYAKMKTNVYYKIESTCEICDTEIIFFKPSIHGRQLNIALQPVEGEDEEKESTGKVSDLGTEDKAGSVFVLENIYYTYNSDKIVQGAKNDLDILAVKMEENPDIKILMESHTDSRGTAAYNLLLSVRRADNAKKYLVEKGIDADRIYIKGLGESRIRNHCTDGVPCTEEEHRYNRRTEVTILPED